MVSASDKLLAVGGGEGGRLNGIYIRNREVIVTSTIVGKTKKENNLGRIRPCEYRSKLSLTIM